MAGDNVSHFGFVRNGVKQRLKTVIRSCWIILPLVLTSLLAFAGEQTPNDNIRILSWNISDDAFVATPAEFQSLLQWANPDVALLDEVAPSANIADLRLALANLQSNNDQSWNIDIGTSGGRQRCIVASRAPQEALPEFSSIVAYPEADKRYILEHMSKRARANADYSMEGGIPVNGAIILIAGRRLLTVIADLQCCGNGHESWQEYRRRVEVREIRARIRQVLERTHVDGIVIAGDFNLVNGATPLVLLTGPYNPPSAGLIAAQLYHPDGVTNWTWDGRGTRFPSNTLDYQLYSPNSLKLRSGFVLDTENLLPATLKQLGLKSSTSKNITDHRPLLAEYNWH